VTAIRIVDTNVVLRYLLADHPELHARAKTLFDAVRAGDIGAHVSESVLAECVYVMQRVYQVPRAEIAARLTDLLGFRGMAGGQISMLRQALGIYAATNLSIVDALIAATAAWRHLSVETFDEGLRKYLDR
jgi:predicted nucleic acid-binding protein